MTVNYRGNFIIIRYNAGEQPKPILLADGYSFETISVVGATNISVIYNEITFVTGAVMTFPPVNSKSPCVLNPLIIDNTKQAYLRLLIFKFGQIPDPHYFDKEFETILVTGEDGKEYNVIPSDQFK
jgi:hypothetical protein